MDSRMSRWFTKFGLFIPVLLVPALYGHAILKSATPQANQAVNGPDIPVELRFNSRIDAKRSRMTLVSADGTERPVSIEGQISPDLLTGLAKGLKRGSYILRWQVLAVDGHITRGEFPFQVH